MRMAVITGFHHTAIRSADFDASVKFYTEVLGLHVRITWGEGAERGAMLDAGDGNYVEIFARDSAFPIVEGTILHFALRTDDCTTMLERVRAAGAEITMEPDEIVIASNAGPVPIKIAFFKGPDGEVIELFENELL
jgi:catechol 2,3-dioxygenase-like lactoylglutathione lyase family enzyme